MSPDAGPGELARLLAARPPLNAMALGERERLLAAAEIEFHPAGSAIADWEATPRAAAQLRIVHSGAVELRRSGALPARLGPGEMFGDAAAAPEPPAALDARAALDTLCYRVAATSRDEAARSAGRPRAGDPAGQSTPWRAADWLAVDLELTGLDPRRHEIVSIGAVPIRRGRVVLGDAFYTLVRPTRPSEPAAALVHRLSAEELASAPPIETALPWLLDRLTGAVPVFHTAAVEDAFLGRALRRGRWRRPTAADTELLGRQWLRRSGAEAVANLPLAHLAARLGQLTDGPHHALGDALATANAFIALAAHLDAERPQTVGSLLDTRAQLVGARRFGPT